jgi:hypothetical protein
MFGSGRLSLWNGQAAAAGAAAVFSAGGYDNSNLDTVSGNNQRTQKIYRYLLGGDTVSLLSILLTNYVDTPQSFANQTVGVITGGGTGDSSGTPVTSVNIITFATEAKTSGTALGTATKTGSGGSSTTKGYVFSTMSSDTTATNNRQDYTYSSGANTLNTNVMGFASARRNVAAANNSTKAVITGGWVVAGVTPQSDIREFTFSGETMAAASYSLFATTGQQSMAGNQTKYAGMGGFVNAGATTLSTRVESYVYSSGSRTAATAMNGHRHGDAAGDDTAGIFTGAATFGSGITANQTTKKYTYSSDTYAVTTAVYSVGVDGVTVLSNQQTC